MTCVAVAGLFGVIINGHFLRGFRMKTLTLKIDDSVSDKFLWLLQHFSLNEVSILDAGEFFSDDA
jgi:hypothetical protein